MDGIKRFFALVICGSLSCESANVLYVIPFTAPSHYIFLRAVGLELAERGHNVTVVTPRLETHPPPNYHQVKVNDAQIWDILGIERPNIFNMLDLSAEYFHELLLFRGGPVYTENTLTSPPLQHLLQQDNKFDLVIVELFFNEAYYALAHKYDAPLVLITAYGNCMRHNFVSRNPLQMTTVVPEFIVLKHPTSFWSRLRSWFFVVYEYIRWVIYLNNQEQLVDKYIPGMPLPRPSLYEMQQNASLVLYNSHFSFDLPTAYLPNIIEVGGLHLSKSYNKLPQDLQDVMDNAKHGVVYVNFGSNVQSSELPENKKQALLNAFGLLKQTVIWKWEQDNLADKPHNVVIRKWLPQKEILAHPNVKVFVTHGGQMGSQEAIFHGVPVIGVPVYADQYNNLLIAQDKGYGRILEYNDITEDSVSEVLNDILENDSYRVKAKEASRIFRDRPMSALETAMFWIEYVIRNKGAEHIKNPALRLNWLQYAMEDVYAFVVAVTLILLTVFMFIIKVFLRWFKTRNAKIQSKNKKDN